LSVAYAAVAGFAFGALSVAVRAGLRGAESPELAAFAATAFGAALCARSASPVSWQAASESKRCGHISSLAGWRPACRRSA
jgi:hypothetical protein